MSQNKKKNKKIAIKYRYRFLSILFITAIFQSQIVASESTSAAGFHTLKNDNYEVRLNSDGTYQVAGEKGLGRRMTQDKVIKLRSGHFDPLRVEKGSKNEAMEGSRLETLTGYDSYMVQFKTHALEAYQEEIKALGGKIYSSIPGSVLIVNMGATTLSHVTSLDFVRWVGRYRPSHKISPSIKIAANALSGSNQNDVTARFSLLVHDVTSGMQDAVARYIQKLGGKIEVISDSSRRIEFHLRPDLLSKLARMPEIQSIDEWPGPDELDDFSTPELRSYTGIDQLERLQGYSGQGVRAEVMDSGVRLSHVEFQRNPPVIHFSNDSDTSHGTRVYSVVFADGINSEVRGVLTDAEQPIFSSFNRRQDRSKHAAELVDPRGRYRAVFQTNSWGSGRTTNYTTISAELDDVTFEHDLLTLQSQSNAGNQNSRPQAWSKNVVAVGGISGRNTFTRSDDRWDSGDGSIGPAADGRIKPDLNFFYEGFSAARHSGDSSYDAICCTSGATPAVAGSFGILFQMWADGVFDGGPGKQQAPLNRDVFEARPHMSTAKALMIHGAFQYDFSGENAANTRVHQGWGQPSLKVLYDIARDNNWSMPILVDEERDGGVLRQGEAKTYALSVNGNKPLKATLVYTDPAGNPSASVHRVNDLSLRVTSPDGTVYWGNNGLKRGNWSTPGGSSNKVDTVENVFIENPRSGTWTIAVLGDDINTDSHRETRSIDADFSLVVSGGTTTEQVNTPPIFANNPFDIADASVGVLYSGSIANQASDAQGDQITFGKVSGPSWLRVFNDGRIEGTPSNTDTGLNRFVVSAADAEEQTNATMNLSVNLTQSTFNVGIETVGTRNTTSADRRAMPFTVNERGTIRSITMYHNGGSGDMQLGVYADDNGKPGRRLGVTRESTVNSNDGWQTIELQESVLVNANTPVWLSWVYENNPGIAYVNGSPGRASSGELWNSSSDNMPSNYGSSSIADFRYSIYITLTN